MKIENYYQRLREIDRESESWELAMNNLGRQEADERARRIIDSATPKESYRFILRQYYSDCKGARIQGMFRRSKKEGE